MRTPAARTCRPRVIALLLGGLLLAAPLVTAPAASATAGVPDAPIALFTENFENATSKAVVDVDHYTGADPLDPIYRADDSWDVSTAVCNGLIVSFAGNAAGCTPAGADANLAALAQKLGSVNGDPTPNDNHALGENEDTSLDPGDIEVRVAEPIEIDAAPGRFIVGGSDVAVLSCAAGAPLISFDIVNYDADPSIDDALSPAPQNICMQGSDLGGGMTGGLIYSDASVLSDFADLTLELHNTTPMDTGSYHALDDLVVADATPQLDQSFASDSVPAGSPVTLTLTVTNTSDLASKDGWSLTDTLPAGLQVVGGSAGRDARATTCPGTTVTAVTGASSVTVSGGNLSSGQVTCTVGVSVTSANTGSFTVSPSQISTVGLRTPGSATVRFTTPVVVTPPPPPPPPAPPSTTAPACSDGIDNDGDGLIDAKDPGCVLDGVYTPQKDSEASIAPIAQCAKGVLQLTDVYGRGGRTVLLGVAGPEDVGKKVAVFSTWDEDKQVATATVKGDLSFSATAPLPPSDIRNTNAARFQARLGSERSLNLKFARRMTETVARKVSATRVTIGGRVTKPLAKPAEPIVVRAAPSCQSDAGFKGTVVARHVKVKPGGAWSTTFTLPASLRGDKVYLRAQTSVRKTTHSLRAFKTFTLIQGVALK